MPGDHTFTGACENCKEKNGGVRRKARRDGPVGEVPSIVHDVLRSSGQPLDSDTRAVFEQGFGHNFSWVRVHTDVKAAESARAVNALAYTVGRDIAFGLGQYAPGQIGSETKFAFGKREMKSKSNG